jgi:hypothetical protein
MSQTVRLQRLLKAQHKVLSSSAASSKAVSLT